METSARCERCGFAQPCGCSRYNCLRCYDSGLILVPDGCFSSKIVQCPSCQAAPQHSPLDIEIDCHGF